MAGTEHFGATAQPRDHIPEFCLSTPVGNHALSRHWQDYPQPRIIFWSLTQEKYHQITRKNSAYWQINTSGLFPYTRLIQVPGCTGLTRSAHQHQEPITCQHRPSFHTRKILARVKVHLQCCSRLINLTPKSLFPRSPKIREQYPTFLSQLGCGWLIRLAKWNENTIRYWPIQTLRIVITLSHLRALLDALREPFLKVTNNEI